MTCHRVRIYSKGTLFVEPFESGSETNGLLRPLVRRRFI